MSLAAQCAAVRLGQSLDAFAAVDAPFAARSKSRFSFGIRQQDGYVMRPDGTDLGDTDTYTATAKFVWTPSESFTGTLAFDYTEVRRERHAARVCGDHRERDVSARSELDAGCPGSDGDLRQTCRPDRSAHDLTIAAQTICRRAGRTATTVRLPLESTLENWGGRSIWRSTLATASSSSRSRAYREIGWEGVRDADNTPLPILHTIYDVDGDQLSQELQLTYRTDALTGVIGLYYFEQTSDDIVTVELNPPPPGVQRDSDNNKVDNDSWAAFTQWTYNSTDKLALTAGGRYTEDEKGSYPDQFDFADTEREAGSRAVVSGYVYFVHALGVDCAIAGPTRRWRTSSYAEGFKGGGWNSHFNAPLTPEQQAALQKFEQEEAETIEVGVKLDLAGNTVRLNIAVFTADYTDMQITYRGPLPAGVAPFLTNAGKASIDGAEVELTWATDERLVDRRQRRVSRCDDR